MKPIVGFVVLTAVFAVTLPIFACFGYQSHGEVGIMAAVVAAAICWIAGLVALAFLVLLRQPQQVVNAIGLSMLFRMGIPMAAGIFLTSLGGPLAEAGVFGMIVGFYLVGLLVETLLAVRLVSSLKGDQASRVA